MLNIAIADDHNLVRKSLVMLINSFDGITVVTEAGNGSALLEGLEGKMVDVVLLDLQMPVLNGFDTCKAIRVLYPDIKVLMVSQLNSKEIAIEALKAGAHGFLSKETEPQQLENSIKRVYDDGFYFGSELRFAVELLAMAKMHVPGSIKNVRLSNRHIAIVKFIAQGLDNTKIAEKLFINIRTVETHRKRIMEKTHSKNFLSVVIFALKNRYFTLEDL